MDLLPEPDESSKSKPENLIVKAEKSPTELVTSGESSLENLKNQNLLKQKESVEVDAKVDTHAEKDEAAVKSEHVEVDAKVDAQAEKDEAAVKSEHVEVDVDVDINVDNIPPSELVEAERSIPPLLEVAVLAPPHEPEKSADADACANVEHEHDSPNSNSNSNSPTHDYETHVDIFAKVGEILEEILARGLSHVCEDSVAVAAFGSENSPCSSLTLIESPLITTPPYEYIVLTPENEKKFRLYLNPKVDQKFKDAISKSKSQSHQSSLEVNDNQNQNQQENQELGRDRERGRERERSKISFSSRSRSSSRSILPLPHRAGNENVVHCFDPSEVDLELSRILKGKPPQTHGIVRRKPRAERGSSVPAIDSYYGCKDLEKVGHASYFIPDLTPQERKALGWKDTYAYGKWKYAPTKIPHCTTGHIPLGATFSLGARSRSKYKSRSRSRSRSISRSKSSRKSKSPSKAINKDSEDQDQAAEVHMRARTKSSSDGIFITTNEATAFITSHKDSDTDSKLLGLVPSTEDVDLDTDERRNLGAEDDPRSRSRSRYRRRSLDELSGSGVSRVGAKQHLVLQGRRLRRWLADIIPCMKPQRVVRFEFDGRERVELGVNITLSRENSSNCSSANCSSASLDEQRENTACAKVFPFRLRGIFNRFSRSGANLNVNRNQNQNRTCHHHHFQKDRLIFGCFPYRTSRKTKVYGGDVLASTEASLASLPDKKAKLDQNLQPESTSTADPNPDVQELAITDTDTSAQNKLSVTKSSSSSNANANANVSVKSVNANGTSNHVPIKNKDENIR